MRKLLSAAILFLVSLTVQAQMGDCKVYKTNGEVMSCDRITTGKTIVCKVKGAEKVKLKPEDILYYTVNDSDKYIVSTEGDQYPVMIENDSVWLVSFEKEVNGMPFEDYYIFRKKGNIEILKIKKTKEALDDLKKYFGGHCPEFDKKIIQYTPKFKKAVFPYDQWLDLVWMYDEKCK